MARIVYDSGKEYFRERYASLPDNDKDGLPRDEAEPTPPEPSKPYNRYPLDPPQIVLTHPWRLLGVIVGVISIYGILAWWIF